MQQNYVKTHKLQQNVAKKKEQFENIIKNNAMENRKTSIRDFINYLEDNDLATVRLLNTLKKLDGFFYDKDVKEHFEDIRYITDRSFFRERNVGMKTLKEFKLLRTEYMQYLDSDGHIKKYAEVQRDRYATLLRLDILKTVKTIEDEIDFVENALLEKFEREGIELHKFNQEEEMV